MKRASSHILGYTIVETMLFLAITGALLASVMLVVGGQQQKAQFRQSVQNADSRIQDIINDVATGYYTNNDKFACTGLIAGGPDAGQPKITPGPNNQGTNEDCIFVGRVIQFAKAGTSGRGLDIYTMVGRRQLASGQEVGNLYEAQIVPIARGNTHTNVPPPVSDIETDTLDGSVTVTKMYYGTNPLANPIGAVGFFSTFASYGSLGINSGSTTTDLLPIVGATSALNMSDKDMVDAMIDQLNYHAPSGNPPQRNPTGGVTICFKDEAGDKYAILTIGSNNRQLTTKVDIVNASAATASGARCEP